MKKLIAISSLMKYDITSIIQRKHYPYTIEYQTHFSNLPPTTSEHWKRTLHEIYIKSPGQYGRGNPPCSDDNILAKRVKITGEQLCQATIFLTEHKMLSLETRGLNETWRITQKGFDVALQNETIASNKKIQHLIVYFMFISASAAVVQAVFSVMK